MKQHTSLLIAALVTAAAATGLYLARPWLVPVTLEVCNRTAAGMDEVALDVSQDDAAPVTKSLGALASEECRRMKVPAGGGLDLRFRYRTGNEWSEAGSEYVIPGTTLREELEGPGRMEPDASASSTGALVKLLVIGLGLFAVALLVLAGVTARRGGSGTAT